MATERRVLLVSSYHPAFPTFKQINGIKSVLDPSGVYLDVEFMDSKRFMNKVNLAAFKKLLKLKLDALDKYSAIITADDNALSFALENKQELFPEYLLFFVV